MAGLRAHFNDETRLSLWGDSCSLLLITGEFDFVVHSIGMFTRFRLTHTDALNFRLPFAFYVHIREFIYIQC